MSLSRPISGYRAASLLIGLRLRRAANGMSLGTAMLRKRRRTDAAMGAASPAPRRATRRPGKWTSNWWLLAVAAMGVLLHGFWLGTQLISRIEQVGGAQAVVAVASLDLCVLALGVVCMIIGLANKDLNRPDSDLEWLLSLPASTAVLHAGKLVAATLANGAAWAFTYPFAVALLWRGGHRASALPLAVWLCLPLFAVVAVWQLALEGLARRHLGARLMRNVQLLVSLVALTTVLFVLFPYLAMPVPGRPPGPVVALWIDRIQSMKWIPFRDAVQLATSSSASISETARGLTTFAMQIAALFAAGAWCLRRAYAHGVIVGAGALRGERGNAETQRRARARRKPMTFAMGAFAKDVLWLWRDKSMLAGAVMMPLTGVAQVLLLNGLTGSIFSSPRSVGAAAFGSGALVIAVTCMSALRGEGAATWLLFTVPTPLSRVLFRKVLVCLPLACAPALVVLATGALRQPASADLIFYAAYALLGLVLYTMLGVALAVDSTDLGAGPGRASGVGSTYLVMLLTGLYATGFMMTSRWPAVGSTILSSVLALAVWQNAVQSFPYVLDVHQKPPPALRLSDGVFAAFIFTVLQGVLFQQANRFGYSGWSRLALVFTVAGVMVVGGAVAVLRRRGVRHVAHALGVHGGRSWRATCARTLLWGIIAVLVAIGHRTLMREVAWFGRWTEEHGRPMPLLVEARDTILCAFVVVCAAPIVEEVIFRGMIYRSLRAKWRLAVSVVVSSALFAAVHPMSHAVPVGLMAICAAMAFEASGSLLAAMTVHAAYNGCVMLLGQ